MPVVIVLIKMPKKTLCFPCLAPADFDFGPLQAIMSRLLSFSTKHCEIVSLSRGFEMLT